MAQKKNLKYTIIDNETRWNSIFNMLYRLLELKEFFQTHHSTNTELKLKKVNGILFKVFDLYLIVNNIFLIFEYINNQLVY